MLSPAEKSILLRFRQYLMTPGHMLCFYGPDLQKRKKALQRLTDKELLVQEKFDGAYSLTPAGFVAMRDCA